MMCAWQRFGSTIMERNIRLTYNLLHERCMRICAVLSTVKSPHCRIHRGNNQTAVEVMSKNLSLRYLAHSADTDDSESDEFSEQDDDPDYEKLKEMSESLRNFLYPDSEDPLLLKLKTCMSVQEVFNIIRPTELQLTSQHVSQAVLVLWDLQKIFYRVYAKEEDEAKVYNPAVGTSDSLRHYINVVSNHEDFKHLIELVNRTYLQMTPDAATCTLLYLRKMDVRLTHPVMQNLVAYCASLIESLSTHFPLTALSRFTVAVYIPNSIWTCMILKEVIPLIYSALDRCENIQDFHLITVCMKNAHALLNWSFIKLYKEIAEGLVSRGEMTAQGTRTILKAAVFLSLPQWSQKNASTIKILLLSLKGKVSELTPEELFMLHKVFVSHLEPADLLEEIKSCANKFLSRISNDDSRSAATLEATAKLLSCVVPFSPPSKKNVFEELARQHIQDSVFSSSLPTVFKLMWHLKTHDTRLCDAFWNKMLQDLENSEAEREGSQLLRTAYRYIHFSNSLGGKYRHFEFERSLLQWLLHEMENGLSGIIPSKFAMIAAFLLAFGNTFQGEVIDELFIARVVDRLVEMAPQFTSVDCLNISRGFQRGVEMCYKKGAHKILLTQYAKVNSVLNTCAQRHLSEKNLDIVTINVIGRAFVNPRSSSQTDIFEHIIDGYEKCNDPLSSRIIRDAVWNFRSFDYLAPTTVDRMVDYITHNKAHVLAETAEKLLTLCYVHGYTPTGAGSFFSAMIDLILRDRDFMVSLAVIRSSLALCFYNSLPKALIHYIFTVDFLEWIEAELSQCYSKDTYPVRVRHNLMELNRAVCLDYPDADVPWFHKKYCQELAVSEPKLKSVFQQDVLKHLITVVGGKQFIESDVFSPYSYKIDFLLLLDAENNPVNTKFISDHQISKIAVLLLREDAFSGERLKGPQQMKQRHLEMLGYRVVGIAARLWQSMFMAEPEAKARFLEDCIFQKQPTKQSELYIK
ncbi:FAST kinase domain-containing protein 1, mitochondrial [Schistocerca serialis cubense]|uniref:FAST kinase domain-containing protein 1, mitochondrial n=1 Tax=Schistocerca serialis cubense TaxID=2023355 RepID=UPI00214F3203|nr:FAST kinase domain-containing protein 1, mitochondrial [Schistocerca serialis cubense]